MKQKTRFLIYILVAAAFVIFGSIAIVTNHNVDIPVSAQEHIDLGRTYLVDLSWEKAVLEFTEAIEIEPLNSDAYLGLAEAYIGMGDTEKAIAVLEEGYSKTGDERLKDMLEELLPPEETTVATEKTTTAVLTEAIVITEETITEAVMETESETSESIFENKLQKKNDSNASYTINVISDKEAHIEIFSKIINDEYEIGYIPELNHDTFVASLARCWINLDNIALGFDLFNLEDYFASYKSWTWNDLYKLNDFVDSATIMIHNENGSYNNFVLYKQYEFQWYINMEVDTSKNKLSFDVAIPQDFDFSFNNYSNTELTVFYYEQ